MVDDKVYTNIQSEFSADGVIMALHAYVTNTGNVNFLVSENPPPLNYSSAARLEQVPQQNRTKG